MEEKVFNTLLLLRLSDVPVVTLEFGTNQQNHANGIKEGADVYFECNIKANPWVYQVKWKQNVS
jgi:Cu/Ag efflux protein CusF